MKYTIKDVQLRHLKHIIGDKIDYNSLMVDILGYKNSWWDRKVLFRYKFKKIYQLIQTFSHQDIKKLSYDIDCPIEMPKNVDALSYQTRIELDQMRGKGSDDLQDLMNEVIAIACFSTVHKKELSSDSELYQSWKKHISQQPLLQMVGLYNELEKALDESNQNWNRLFLQVQVLDQDYDAVNGQAYLGRFNLLNTVKKLMIEFRVSYKEAFSMEYRLVMTNNLEQSSKGYVGERMRLHKERVFKAQRK